ncbi:MAG: hypothetical protein RJB38_2053 [Pseudomonadota bacterium]|jgi:hypothetical protein
MKRGLSIGFFFVMLCSSRWLSHAEALPRESSDRLRAVFQILGRSPSGRELLEAAQDHWKLSSEKELSRFIKWDRSSRTDAVLIRHFNPSSGVEERERQVTVSLKSTQRLEEIVLDLAHELIHATAQPAWDPYDPQLSAAQYVHAAIEGKGGEVEAVVRECQVALELAPILKSESLGRCEPYIEDEAVVASLVRQDFYRVGSWHSKLLKEFGKDHERFPLLSAKAPRLYSSTGHSPYPAALLQEFQELTASACENSKNRLKTLSASRRSPSAEGSGQSLEKVQDFIERRCRSE